MKKIMFFSYSKVNTINNTCFYNMWCDIVKSFLINTNACKNKLKRVTKKYIILFFNLSSVRVKTSQLKSV